MNTFFRFAVPLLAAAPVLGLPNTPTTGSELAWGDFDGDGLADALAIAPDGVPALLRNLGDGTFEDRTDSLPDAGRELLASAAWGDLDADGLGDLLLVDRAGTRRVLLNGGGGAFADVTLDVGLDASESPTLAARWLDYDGDRRDDVVLFTATGPQLFHNVGGTLMPVPYPGADRSITAPGALVLSEGVATPSSTPGRDAVAQPLDSTSANVISGQGRGSGSSATSFGGSIATPGDAPNAAGAAHCAPSLQDLISGGCLTASSVPQLGALYPISEDWYVDPTGFVGLGTIAPLSELHVKANNQALQSSALHDDDLIVAAADAYIGLYSSGGGTWGSTLTFSEVDGSGGLTDKWAVARTTDGSGDPELRITYGSDKNHSANDAYLSIEPPGFIGMGTTEPEYPLHVVRTDASSGRTAFIDASNAGPGTALNVRPGSDNQGSFIGGSAQFGWWGELIGVPLGVKTVEISTAPDNEGLIRLYDNNANTVAQLSSDATSDGNLHLWNDEGELTVLVDAGDGANAGLVILRDAAGTDRIVLDASQGGKGRVTCGVLEVRGGADIVESFDTREGDVEPGTVVVIDEENPGDLRVSTDPYDKRVAGIASGAGGIDPGLSLGQEGLASGDTKVALTGRVYVKASAENGPIRAGDRLTTASTAGHAMRVDDDNRAIGAVLGKAMSELDEGTGLVLVLVNLQ